MFSELLGTQVSFAVRLCIFQDSASLVNIFILLKMRCKFTFIGLASDKLLFMITSKAPSLTGNTLLLWIKMSNSYMGFPQQDFFLFLLEHSKFDDAHVLVESIKDEKSWCINKQRTNHRIVHCLNPPLAQIIRLF